jgi:hypothetical protein
MRGNFGSAPTSAFVMECSSNWFQIALRCWSSLHRKRRRIRAAVRVESLERVAPPVRRASRARRVLVALRAQMAVRARAAQAVPAAQARPEARQRRAAGAQPEAPWTAAVRTAERTGPEEASESAVRVARFPLAERLEPNGRQVATRPVAQLSVAPVPRHSEATPQAFLDPPRARARRGKASRRQPTATRGVVAAGCRERRTGSEVHGSSRHSWHYSGADAELLGVADRHRVRVACRPILCEPDAERSSRDEATKRR